MAPKVSSRWIPRGRRLPGSSPKRSVRAGWVGNHGAGVVAATSEGEAILTARADGAIVRITQHLGDNVRQGETIALIESREAATLLQTAARQQRCRGSALCLCPRKRLFDARVTARQDLEAAQASLAEAEPSCAARSRRICASKLSGDGRTLAIVSPISPAADQGRRDGLAPMCWPEPTYSMSPIPTACR
jgi:cobalt-zinc-cadmium efflux system membrane fusion protein